jgi:predicted enzyme related to lactoylglutathione lyase
MPPVGDASWHELATTDGAAGRESYANVFGWQAMGDVDMGGGMTYRMIGRHGAPLGASFDITDDMPGMRTNWAPCFRVTDVRAAIGTVKANGGSLLNGPMEVPGGDEIAQCLDPQGGDFCVHETKAA